MSGICAVLRKENPGRLKETLTSAGRGLLLTGTERVEQKTDGAAGVAISKGFATQQVFENDRLLLACDADLYDTGAEATGDTAALLAQLYEKHGSGFVEKLQGSFSVVLWEIGRAHV